MRIFTDGSSNMIIKKGTVVTNRYETELPHLIVVQDYCHSLNLFLQDCLKKFPCKFIKIVEDIPPIFRYSATKTNRLVDFIKDKTADSKVERILKYVPTRWTSFYECLGRIVELSEPLITFFKDEGTENQKRLLRSHNLKILMLLHTLLGKLNSIIKDFEKENLDMMTVVRKLKLCLTTFGRYLFNLNNITAGTADELERIYRFLMPFMDVNND